MELKPAQGFFCADQARYALFSSCTVPADRQGEFSEAVEELLTDVVADASCVVASVCPPSSSQIPDRLALPTAPL